MSACPHNPFSCAPCLRIEVEELRDRLDTVNKTPFPETRATTEFLQHLTHGLQSQVRQLSEELGKVKEENNVLRGRVAELMKPKRPRKRRTK